LLSVAQALTLVLEHAKPKAPALTALRETLGLVLAEEVVSDIDSPPHDKATVDGYAVITADLVAGHADLGVLEEVAAGQLPQKEVSPGFATRVMTGAPIPRGADAMVMIERAETLPPVAGQPRVLLRETTVAAGQNIMRRGVALRHGDHVLSAGCEIRPIEIGVLAEVGRASVRVYPRSSVSVLATGDELVSCNRQPGPGQIRNINGPLLVAAALRTGATAIDLEIARDEKHELRERIERGLQSDVLLISGGVSAGVLDLAPAVLAVIGVRQVFHKVDMKPGKPLWFGVYEGERGETLVFGLPGNPVSGLVCFELFVRPALGRLAGKDQETHRTFVAELSVPFTHRGDRPTYHPGRLDSSQPPRVEPLAWQGSGDLQTLTRANALIHFPAGEQSYAAGLEVDVSRI
jgi:molybdopterin molybdotransferase